MSAAIKREFPDATVDLVGGGRGDFIVTANGVELWNKNQVGDFPDDQQILTRLHSNGSE